MKKLYIVLIVCLSAINVSAQSRLVTTAKAKMHQTAILNGLENQVGFNEKGGGLPIWSDDFSTPSNWTLSAEVGSDNWVIGTSGPAGSFAIPAIASPSAANGFALFDSDLLCSGNQVANLTTANSINLTGYNSVLLEFNQMYARFYDSTFVFVSTNGTSWTKFPVNTTYANNDDSPNPDVVQVNITSVAGNQATVWVRFQFYSPSSMGGSAGCGYAWMIDDVSIIPAPDNDLVIGSVYHSEYSKIPVGQETDINLSAKVTNNGGAAQTNVRLNVVVNNTLFDETGTPTASLAVGANDSLYLNQPFTPSGVGNYNVVFNIQQDETDGSPSNNTKTGSFAVTQALYSRDNDIFTGSGTWFGTGVSYEMANYFEITTTAYAYSISAAAFINGTVTSKDVRVKIYEVDGNGDLQELAVSDFFTVTPAHQPTGGQVGGSPTVFTVPFPNSIELAPGGYYAALENESDPSIDFITLSGTSLYQVNGSSIADLDDEQMWGYVSFTPFIRLNAGLTPIGIEEKSGITNLNVIPNPASNNTLVSFSLEESLDNASISLFDMVGKRVSTQFKGDMKAGGNSVNLDISNLPSGIYNCIIGNDSRSINTKIVVAR